MSILSRTILLSSLIGVLILPVVMGCRNTSPESALASANNSNLKRLANLYVRFQADHSWRGPADEQEFRRYIETSVPDFVKQRIGVTSIDELFVSSRDRKPFRIRYQITGSPRGCQEPAIFEDTGYNNRRLVGFLNMVQRDVEEQEYSDLWEGKFQPPPEITAD